VLWALPSQAAGGGIVAPILKAMSSRGSLSQSEMEKHLGRRNLKLKNPSPESFEESRPFGNPAKAPAVGPNSILFCPGGGVAHAAEDKEAAAAAYEVEQED